MRSTLYLKFLFIYIIFGFLTVFVGATLSSELLMNHLEDETTSTLYTQATTLSSQYLPDYFSEDLTISEVSSLLSDAGLYLDASLWLVDSSGTVITSSTVSGEYSPPTQIEDFNPAETGNSHSIIGNYHGYLANESISVIAPITQGIRTNGYLIIHKKYSDLVTEKIQLMQIVYISFVVIYLLSFVILLAFHILIYIPLRKVTEAATQYASGNLNHEISVYTHDEMGYLSASLNYMSAQLKDIEDYQRKFIGNVSHDFRSPLTSIRGYIQAMVDGTIPCELQEKYLNIILFETERLTDLTKDLLALNEMDTKELLLNKELFDIHKVIKNVATSFEGACKPKHISIELLFASKALYVYADKSKMQQVLYNLLDNAIKFSLVDSRIIIETSELPDKTFVSIKDFGSGIPKQDLQKVWDRFYKSDTSRGKDKRGTGLGLSIVKEIMKAHNENINVISTEGVGTEFIFSITKEKIN